MQAQEEKILGFDPGTNIMGYGCITIRDNKPVLLGHGVVNMQKISGTFQKLREIFRRCTELIEHYQPGEVAIESPFYGKNVQSMLKLGRAQGVAIAAAVSREVEVYEYAPRKIKQSITGNGNSSKTQVAGMLEHLISSGDAVFTHLDATDAIATAICHYFQKNRINPSGGGSWEKFIRDNPDRLA